jgi:hypothetical protein
MRVAEARGLLPLAVMRHTLAELRDEIQHGAAHLRMLRDDALTHLFVGGPVAEREWHRLEPVVLEALRRAECEVSEESCWLVARAAMELRRLCGSLRGMALEGTIEEAAQRDPHPDAARYERSAKS